ncbi:uncharacterized protein [Parasteatoda tepidariorum]|uniref:uncharacterized protein n=1 Tax=Parasteatoda tepidariorum TaxID=114398 RepID=UPI0039BCD2FC
MAEGVEISLFKLLISNEFSPQAEESTLPGNAGFTVGIVLRRTFLFANTMSAATDGPSAMVGRHRGFIALLKREIPDILTIHCVIHRNHLVGISEIVCMSHCNMFISAVNKIRSSILNDR